jgi:biofilm PGA synthesis N-glycosyltransferase PgaC
VIILYIILVLGISTIFWSSVGLLRASLERSAGVADWLGAVLARLPFSLVRPRGEHEKDRHPMLERWARNAGPMHRATTPRIVPSRVAVIIAAHNEALVIGDTIRTVSMLVPHKNIHIISDKSTDATAAIARGVGVNVLELDPNRGKAGALDAGIKHFKLCDRFDAVMLLDADTQPAADYLETGLPLFDDPDVAAVAGRAKSIMDPPAPTWFGRFLVYYRERLYVAVQLMLKYGQAARSANVVSIVPGFASMYRTSALRHINILAPGLVIEDFNMTFEIHAQQLGRIAFHPQAATAYTQDPDTFRDYSKQVSRWILGFWQTVRRHKVRFSRFWLVMGLHIVELVFSSIFFVILIPLFLLSTVSALMVSAGDLSPEVLFLSGLLRPRDLLIGVFVPDFILTILATISVRKPLYLLMAPFFPFMRIVDAFICLRALPKAFSSKSTGVWVSPQRRPQSVTATDTLKNKTPMGA